jgi:benzoyl-CoA reductase subunit BamC
VGEKKRKIVKTIKVDADKCNGCRACEVVCSAFHAAPKYSSNNPARSRIQVIRHPLKDIYVPVYAGEYTAAECMGRDKYVIDGKEYEECAFCRASCPSRDLFKEPDSGLPLKCDMCEDDPPQDEPLCVKWCLRDALTYEEREEEVDDEEEVKLEEMEVGLESLVDKFGLQKVMDTVARMSQKGEDIKA